MNYRLLVLGVKAFVTEAERERVIYLTSMEDKDDVELTKLLKKQGIIYSTVEIPGSPKFKLKFINHNNTLRLLAKNENLGDQWYRVMNFNTDHIPMILEQNNLEHGEIVDEFEPIFNKNNGTLISFVSPSMKEYEEYLDEMTRIINCSLYKKTKKVTLGHRYDTLTETRFYIGKVSSRKSCKDSSIFLDKTAVIDAYLYVNKLNPGDKTIDDIFKTRIYGSGVMDIKADFSKTPPAMVDSGEALEVNGKEDIREYWDDILNHSIDSCKRETKEGYEYYENYEPILDLFSYQTTDLDYNLSEPSKLKLEDCMKKIFKHLLLMHWDKLSYRADLIIGKNKTDAENIVALVKLFYENLGSENVMRHLYYADVLTKLGIDINKMAQEVFGSWVLSNELYTSFDTYYKHLFYIRRNKIGEVFIDYRVKNPKTLKDLYVDSHLERKIMELVNEAKSNYGIGVNDYKVNTDGSITCKITLEDIMHKEGSSLSEELKADIVNYRFNNISLTFDDKHPVE
jgi:hypothetical protein